jgi:D-alanyl-D-alanine carboxypeptidase
MIAVVSGCTSATIDPEAGYGGVDEPIGGDTAAALQQVLVDAVALSGSSGGLAAVAAPWAGDWQGATGTERFDEGSPAVSADAGLQLAGVTGEMTCLLLLRLADEGVVDLDDPVTDHVDDIPGLDGITLEQLCRHTSGLADYYPGLRVHFMQNPQRVWSPIELISSSLALPRTGAPGESYSYSRSGLLLLAIALERTTDRSWNDLASEYLFDPLGLETTVLPAPPAVQTAGALGAYAARPGPDGAPDCAARLDASVQSSSMGGAAAGGRSTLDDVVAFSQAFSSGALLSERLAREQWTTGPISNAPEWITAGLGGMTFGPLRGTVSESTGALTAAMSDPATGLTVVISLNNSSAGEAFVREAAYALASVAAKAPAAGGETAPLVELPWSAEQAAAGMQQLARCQNQ